MTTWILEDQVFADRHRALAEAVERAGGAVISWNDDWWATGAWPATAGPVVFHGSLGNADRIAS
ncbi:hypothetical protein AADG42_15635 [Ammonicoccus fulvus]|uniref:Uncharacterized protein n=1 Tax=Ammonicoccus fulvus TaxID=3138240 RepID=A0ABZ3FU21_9ACTN